MWELGFGRNLVKFLCTGFSYTLRAGGMERALQVGGGLDLNPPVCLLSNLQAVWVQWFFKLFSLMFRNSDNGWSDRGASCDQLLWFTRSYLPWQLCDVDNSLALQRPRNRSRELRFESRASQTCCITWLVPGKWWRHCLHLAVYDAKRQAESDVSKPCKPPATTFQGPDRQRR